MRSPKDYVAAIKASNLSIYDPVDIDSSLYIPSPELEILLNVGLRGFSTWGMSPRTRSKAVKTEICRILGYPIPLAFKKTKPRFLGQNFDTYIQKSNNLQIWNEELAAKRRYVLIQEKDHTLTRVKVLTGETLAKLDTTGTLTQKYQARMKPCSSNMKLISAKDTTRLLPLIDMTPPASYKILPTSHPKVGKLFSISVIFDRLCKLIGQSFSDLGQDQDRNRGARLHKLVCKVLGYTKYADDGDFLI